MTDQEIEQLPTILSILDQIAGGEEGLRNNDINSFLLSNLGSEGKFEIFPEYPEDPWVLKPTTANFNSYFRGQYEFHEDCCPTIYRTKWKDEIDNFIDRLRSSEFELLLQTHPFVRLVYEDGIVFRNFDKDVWVKLKVDSLGLAQHYELDTDMIDLSSDKWVAAFFATCIKKNGRYVPIDESNDKVRFGVIYRYSPPIEPFVSPIERRKFSVIGLQPFKRPGEQKGFTLQLDKGENLNQHNGITPYFFRHNKLAAEIIYNRMNQGKELFPYDELEELSKKIKCSKKISNMAFEIAYEKYPINHMDIDKIRIACSVKGIKFVNYPIVSFPKGLEKVFLRNWAKNGEKEFYAKIVHRPTFVSPETSDI